jgi:Mg2+ and Co2+ transporter CorA
VAKRKLYETMIDRMKKAADADFHLEAAWFAYAVLEDRTTSMLKALGRPPRARAQISKKIEALQKMADEKGGALAVYLNRDAKPERGQKASLLEDVGQWCTKRNGLVHAMASGSHDIDALDKLSGELSKEGQDLVRVAASVARRIKKHADKL